MWKVLGIIAAMLLCIIPGAIVGAFVGMFVLPAKIWALFGEYETSDVSTHNDEI